MTRTSAPWATPSSTAGRRLLLTEPATLDAIPVLDDATFAALAAAPVPPAGAPTAAVAPPLPAATPDAASAPAPARLPAAAPSPSRRVAARRDGDGPPSSCSRRAARHRRLVPGAMGVLLAVGALVAAASPATVVEAAPVATAPFAVELGAVAVDSSAAEEVAVSAPTTVPRAKDTRDGEVAAALADPTTEATAHPSDGHDTAHRLGLLATLADG